MEGILAHVLVSLTTQLLLTALSGAFQHIMSLAPYSSVTVEDSEMISSWDCIPSCGTTHEWLSGYSPVCAITLIVIDTEANADVIGLVRLRSGINVALSINERRAAVFRPMHMRVET